MAKDEINAFLGASAAFEGRLTFTGTVRIDGRFEGEVASSGALVVGREASVRGVLKVGRLTSAGLIEGEVTASEKVTLGKTAVMSGLIRTPALVIEDGARIEGRVAMDSGPAAAEVEPSGD